MKNDPKDMFLFFFSFHIFFLPLFSPSEIVIQEVFIVLKRDVVLVSWDWVSSQTVPYSSPITGLHLPLQGFTQ